MTEATRNETIESAVEQSIEIVRRRIDETGTKEPTIQRQGEDRIIIQLPGIDNPEEIKRLLGQTAKMSFHLVNDNVSTEDILAAVVFAGDINAVSRKPGPRMLANASQSRSQR